MEIEAQVRSIEELENYFFLVPDYQREYVWQPDDQVEQFIIDIDNEYEENPKLQKSYFIGSIIIVKNKGKYDVIDGQQRLTTLVLSLCAFRDLLKPQQLGDKHKEYLKKIEKFLYAFNIATDDTLLRLELQYQESNGYLEKLIKEEVYEEELTPSVKKMMAAHAKLKSHFEGYLKEGLESLMSYVRYFLLKIELVVIKSENLSSALKIFETINQRGAGLNAMDLVKNLLFSEANETDFQKIKEIWKDIINNLQQCKEDGSPLRFLRYFVMARYHKGIVREDEIYKWIITPEGKAATQYESQPLAFAKELQKISKRYAELVLATQLVKDGGAFPYVTNIGFINKYRSRQHLILLLALDTTASNEVIEYLAMQIESFFFFSNSMGIQAKYNESLFAKWALQLRGKKSLEEVKLVIKDYMVPYIANKLPQFKSTFLNLYHGYYNPLYRLRFVLGKLENTARIKAGLPIKGMDSLSRLQIEHILPQTPQDDKLPYEEYVDKDDYDSNVYKLGNVTLLESAINQAVSSFNDLNGNWFERKQKEYTNSHVLLTNLLNHDYSIGKNTAINRLKAELGYSYTSWGKETIQDRQKIMMELAFESWKFNDQRIDKQDI